jgi:hypothetical protein
VTRKRKTTATLPRRGRPGFAAAVAEYARPGLAFVGTIFPPRVVLFVALFAWYLWAVVDLRLVFQTRDMLFLWNFRYFTDFLGQPGSLLDWADKLLVQLCYNGWPGAIALGGIVWLLLISTIQLTNAVGRANIGGTWVIPGVLLVVVYSRYLFPSSVVAGLALTVTGANVWCRMPVWRPWLRLLLFVAVSVVLYYVAGEAYYCFAACCAIHEALTERRRLSGVLFLLAAVAVKYGLDAALIRLDLASHTFHVLSHNEERNSPLDWRLMALYLYFPACSLFAVFRQRMFSFIAAPWRRLVAARGITHPLDHGQSGDKNLEDIGGRNRNAALAATGRWIRWTGGTVLVLSLPTAAGYYSLDRTFRTLKEIDYCAEHRLWNDLLAKAQSLPPTAYSRTLNHDVNRALYHAGRLPYQLFQYPQLYGPALNMDDVSGDAALFCKPCDLLMELGRVNDAEQLAMEMLEMRPCGGALKRLALAKLVKDQLVDARVVLNVLRDDLVWGQWADQSLRRLAVDPDLAGDEEVQRIRRVMLSKDDLHKTTIFRTNGRVSFRYATAILSLLEQNSKNRMAFEYLMTLCLCNHDVQGVAELFPLLDGLSYPTAPPFYEEALMLYLVKHPAEGRRVGSECFFHDRKISESTMRKFRRLHEIAVTHSGSDEARRSAVARELADTYFYYFYCVPRKRP